MAFVSGKIKRLGARLRIDLVCALVASSLAAPSAATAATATANLTVQLTVASACTISATSLNFGTVSGAILVLTVQTASANVSVTCTSGSPFSLGMDNGQNYAVSRRMANGANYIPYGLFTDSGFAIPWTTATDNLNCALLNSCYLGTGTGSAQSIPVYGRVPITLLMPAALTYSDTVVMTVTY